MYVLHTPASPPKIGILPSRLAYCPLVAKRECIVMPNRPFFHCPWQNYPSPHSFPCWTFKVVPLRHAIVCDWSSYNQKRNALVNAYCNTFNSVVNSYPLKPCRSATTPRWRSRSATPRWRSFIIALLRAPPSSNGNKASHQEKQYQSRQCRNDRV